MNDCAYCANGALLSAGRMCSACKRGVCAECRYNYYPGQARYGAMIAINGGASRYYYCTNCISTCATCQTQVSNNYIMNVVGIDDRALTGCRFCITRCSYCRRYMPSGEYLGGHQDRCARERQERIERDTVIHNYSYKPDPRFLGRSADGLFFGIEHEVEAAHGMQATDLMLKVREVDTSKAWYGKYDSSMHNGVELVSHPMSFDYFHKHYPEGMAEIVKQHATNQYNGQFNCGVHIHLSRDAFKPTKHHLFRFLQFMNDDRFHPMIVDIAGRDGNVENIRGHGPMAAFGVNPKQFIKRRLKDGDRYNPDNYVNSVPARMLDMEKGHDHGDSRYRAVNVQNRTTVELRIFRSTTNHRRLRAYVQFADALFYYTKTCRWRDKRNPENEMSPDNFIKFVHKRPAKYADLIAVFAGDPALAV
jgi:hypothetical protein